MPAPSDLWIKVPGPFFGVDSVGFSVRCPDAAAPGPLPDVPFFVEGDPDRITPLADRLRRFPERERYVDCAALG
ncbi:MAG: hypothetical protein ACRENV_08150, partial [Candidatus Dormibacteria bacterium]